MKILFLLTSMIIPFTCFSGIAEYAFKNEDLNVNPISVPYNEIANYPAKQQWDQEFLRRYGEQWGIVIDLRGGVPVHIFGQGIPFIPGSGNDLAIGNTITETDIINGVMDFLNLHSNLFNINPKELYISNVTNIDETWYINFTRKYNNINVTGSRVLATISHGNLVRISAINWGNIDISVEPSFSQQQITDILSTYLNVQNQLGNIILTPISLSILPVKINGDNKTNYTGNIGEGYGHILTHSIAIESSEEGSWVGLVDAHSGEVVAFYARSLAASESGKVLGNIYYYSGQNELPTFSANPFAIPFADLREVAGECFGEEETITQCSSSHNCPLEETLIPFTDIYCEDNPQDSGMLFCSQSNGTFIFDNWSNLRTRLYGPYINIAQSIHKGYDDDYCHCGYNDLYPTFMCIDGDNTGDGIVLDLSTDDIDQCSVTNLTTANLGNNSASRTAFYHGNWMKQTWRSKLRTHSRPFDSPNVSDISICPEPNYSTSFRHWLTTSTKIKMNYTNCQQECSKLFKQGCYKHDLAEEKLICLAQDVIVDGTSWGNISEYPDILYHELGHGLDDHDGVCIWPGVNDPSCPEAVDHSSEAYADIVTTLLTRSSCIGRGVIDQECDGDEWDRCESCPGGLRDIDYTKHEMNTRYTPEWIAANDENSDPNLPDYCEPINTTPGPCGLNPYCEGQVATQAFWDLKNHLASLFGPNQSIAEATAWELVDILFSKSIFQMGPQFYRCDSGISDSDGCLPSHLFWNLIVADDNDGNLCNGTPHFQQIQDMFDLHKIGLNLSKRDCQPQDDQGNPICSITNTGPLCQELNSPNVIVKNVGNNVIQLEWDVIPGAQSYRVMKNPFGLDLGNELAGRIYNSSTSGKVSFIDGGVANGQPYYYRILPVAETSACIGKISQSVSGVPGGSLFILPDLSDFNDEILWVQNKFKSFPLAAYGGLGDYSWSVVGALPTNIILDENTGVLSGTTSTLGSFPITINAVDNNNPTLSGQHQYIVKVLTGAIGNLEMTTYLPTASVGIDYNVNLGVAGGIRGYRLQLTEGNLPDGLYIQNPSPGVYHIIGFPTMDSIGVYTITLSLSAENNLGNRIILEQQLHLAVLNKGHLGQEALVVSPEIGSTVGGNNLTFLFKTTSIRAPDLHRLQFVHVPDPPDSQACTDSEISSEYPDQLTFTELQAEPGNYQYLINVESPTMSEGKYYIRLHRPASGVNICADNTFSAKTLAFTSGFSSTISVINTTDDQLHDTDLSTANVDQMSLHADPLIVGLAFSKKAAREETNSSVDEGRKLYAVDYGSGNLQVYDTASFSYEDTVLLQDTTTVEYKGYGAIDAAVDSSGFAYVIHQTAGLERPCEDVICPIPIPSFNPSPGSVSVIDTTTNTLIDADPEYPYSEPGWPPGIHRIRTPRFYPYTISILRLNREPAEYLPGDGYPGEYAFISGVGPQPPVVIGWFCYCIDQNGNLGICHYDPDCTCQPGYRRVCLPILDNRPTRVGILDLNPFKVDSVDTGTDVVNTSDNTNYRKFLGSGELGVDGRILGLTNQGLDFSVASDGNSATVYAVSPHDDKAFYFDFLQAVNDPYSFPFSEISLIPGSHPVDVKIQDVQNIDYAFITTAWNDSVSVIDTSGNVEIDTIYLSGSACSSDPLHPSGNYPQSIDTRGDGSRAYTADRLSSSVSIIDLTTTPFECREPIILDYNEDTQPLKILVQPMQTTRNSSQAINNTLVYASEESFSTSSKQSTLIRDWEDVDQLQQTSADERAVLSNIDNFQRTMNMWVTDDFLKDSLNQSVDLYRTVYLMDNP